MAVAKTYENMEIIGEPFDRNGKPYVKVRGVCQRCGGSGHYSYNQMDGTRCYGCRGTGYATISVRWYTDNQRAAMDRAAEKRAEAAKIKKEARRIKWAARNAFGFRDAGYITIFKGDSNVLNEWAHETNPCRARYATFFGWYVPADMPIENLPEGITPIKLMWDDIRDETDPENLTMKDNAWVEEYVSSLRFEPSKSEYQGEIGGWLECKVTIKKNVELDGRYGISHMHIMEDENENVYVWTTSSKNIEADTTLNLRMKVKDHQEYKGVKQTVVYYCKVK